MINLGNIVRLYDTDEIKKVYIVSMEKDDGTELLSFKAKYPILND